MFATRRVSAAIAIAVLASALGAEAYAHQRTASRATPSARASMVRGPTHPADVGARPADGARLCDKVNECQFTANDPPITTGWSPYQILGGAVDNCGPTSAKYVTEISDERGESNSTEAGFSYKAAGEALGFAKASIELKVSSKQMGEVSTTTTKSAEVNLGPAEEASVETRVWTATVHYTVKDLVHNIVLIPNYQVNFPGFKFPGDDQYLTDGAVQFRTNHDPLNTDEKNACQSLTP